MKWQHYTAIFLLLFAGIYSKHLSSRKVNLPANVLAGFPREFAGWRQVREFGLSDQVVKILKVDEYVNGDFARGGEDVSLYIGYYRSHQRFAEIHTPENCQANGGWEIVRNTRRSVMLPSGGREGKVDVIESVYRKDGSEYAIIYFYRLIDHTTASFFDYKMGVVLNSLLRNRSDAAFVRIMVPVRKAGADTALRTGEAFLADLIPVVNALLP